MKEKIYDIVSIILIILSVIGILIMINVAQEIKNRNMCYNLPINDFFKDSKCKKYIEELENE